MADNPKETQTQIDQMKIFIINEAKDKCEEIATKALQEFDIEKLKIVNATKEKVRQEYSKKLKAAETKKAIERSTAINRSRLEKIRMQQDMMTALWNESKTDLAKEMKGEAKHKEFITKVIVQGLLKLLEDQVQVRCRACDDSLVKQCISQAQTEYSQVVEKETGAKKTCKVVLDEANKLSPSILGGVVLTCQNGTITIDNTLDSRLKLVLEQAKPQIRGFLFSK